MLAGFARGTSDAGRLQANYETGMPLVEKER